jgi:maleate isomerase
MTDRKRLGMLTPSSNTALEPLTAAMLHDLPDITAHFGRFQVTEISLSEYGLGQFQLEPMLAAARMLAEAHVHVICWNGTSSGWRGFDTDEELCRQITEETGVPATTSVLALNDVLRDTGVERLGLVTPYSHGVQDAIVANYAKSGIECSAERHLDIEENFDFAEVEESVIEDMVRDVANAGPQAITTFSTNLKSAQLAEKLEAETGLPVYDTVSTALWKSMKIAGADSSRVTGWGRLFREP